MNKYNFEICNCGLGSHIETVLCNDGDYVKTEDVDKLETLLKNILKSNLMSLLPLNLESELFEFTHLDFVKEYIEKSKTKRENELEYRNRWNKEPVFPVVAYIRIIKDARRDITTGFFRNNNELQSYLKKHSWFFEGSDIDLKNISLEQCQKNDMIFKNQIFVLKVKKINTEKEMDDYWKHINFKNSLWQTNDK